MLVVMISLWFPQPLMMTWNKKPGAFCIDRRAPTFISSRG